MGCTFGLLALLCFLASVWVCEWARLQDLGVITWLPHRRGRGGGEHGVGTCSVGYEYVIFWGLDENTGWAF